MKVYIGADGKMRAMAETVNDHRRLLELESPLVSKIASLATAPKEYKYVAKKPCPVCQKQFKYPLMHARIHQLPVNNSVVQS